ncbi:Sybindin-like protein [Blastocladiella britannica]|nr:Sybindin-like protein [Blastocladiella britannica]
MLLSLWIISKSGGLIFQRDFADRLSKLSTNDYLVLAGTFHSVHAISSRLAPAAAPSPSSGIETLEADTFTLTCHQTPTGIKFLLLTDPQQPQVDSLVRRVYDLYADYVMKNPFYTPEMPVRCELFDVHLAKYVKAVNG